MSAKIGQLEDGLEVTQHDLTAATIKGNQIREELTKEVFLHLIRCRNHNKSKANLDLIKFGVIVAFAVVILTLIFSPYIQRSNNCLYVCNT